MATNNKPAAELRIGTVKATVWGKRGRRDHPSQRHLLTDLPRGGPSGRPRRASFRHLLSVAKLADQRRTRSSPSARPRRPRRLATTKPAKRRTFRRRVKPRRLFSLDARAGERTGRAFRNDHCVRILQQALPWGGS